VTPKLIKLKKKTLAGMIDYMKYGGADDENDPEFDPEFDAGYTQKHIDQCSKIIDDLFASLKAVSDKKRHESIMKAVRTAVVKLNKLNEKCNGMLIETDQREDLCELILSAAKQAGLKSDAGDITEEWREW
jgi:hypothetical protein